MLCFKNDSVFYSIVRRGGYKEEPTAAATVKSLQSCPTLCDPIDGSPLGSSVPGILQAKILEWVAISFSNVRKWKVKVKSFSRVGLIATPGLQPTRLLHPWDSPGKSTWVGCHCLLPDMHRGYQINVNLCFLQVCWCQDKRAGNHDSCNQVEHLVWHRNTHSCLEKNAKCALSSKGMIPAEFQKKSQLWSKDEGQSGQWRKVGVEARRMFWGFFWCWEKRGRGKEEIPKGTEGEGGWAERKIRNKKREGRKKKRVPWGDWSVTTSDQPIPKNQPDRSGVHRKVKLHRTTS